MLFQNGKPSEYNPTIPGLSVTPQKFARMSADSQKDLIAVNSRIGWQGETNPDWGVPPQCQRGITLGEMIEIDDYVDSKIQEAGRAKQRDINYKQRLSKMEKLQKENEQNRG